AFLSRRRNILPVGATLVLVCASCAPVDSGDEKASPKSVTSASGVSSATVPSVLPSEASPVVGNDKLLQGRIESVIDQVRQRDLLLSNGFWTVFHGILGLGPSVQLKHPVSGNQVNAVDYIGSGGELRGLRF